MADSPRIPRLPVPSGAIARKIYRPNGSGANKLIATITDNRCYYDDERGQAWVVDTYQDGIESVPQVRIVRRPEE